MADEIDQFFDNFLATGGAPWIASRTGDSVDATPDTRLPPGILDLPQLDAVFPANMLSSSTNKSWYIPAFDLLADDEAFHFDVVQSADGVTPEGKPVNAATLTLSLKSEIPANLKPIIGKPGAPGHADTVPDLTLIATLLVPVTTRNGSLQSQTTQGTVMRQSDGTYQATFALSQGPVEAAYEHLTNLGGATLELSLTYSGWQLTQVILDPLLGRYHFKTFGDGSQGASIPVNSGFHFRYFPVTARLPPSPPPRVLPIGLSFATDAFRSRFRIKMRDGHTRPIIDANDLDEFAADRSEYRELTSLGDVQTNYPSLRRLYLGQISGVVVAVPARYGILHGASGLSAECDAVVDPSSSLSGSRFHFTFTIAPMVDPIDLAKLGAALRGAPEATGRDLRLALPSGLDPRNPSTLNGFPSAKTTFADGFSPHTIEVSVEIADDRDVPSITNVNLFLGELASAGEAPLFANLTVRLDDLFVEPVETLATLNLHQTAVSDDLSAEIAPGPPPVASATNKGPFDLVLDRFALLPQLVITELHGKALGAGQSTTLTTDATGAVSVVVARSLLAPNPIPKKTMLEFIKFNTQTVQEIQHALTVQAAIDFSTAKITSISVAFVLAEAPALAVPSLTLVASHMIDFVHVLIPVDTAVTGLEAVVTLTITTPSGVRNFSLSHDFVDEPILTITKNTIA
ncbi:MAG TPA: hypothetical protein VNT30_24410 [Stellaceae bacterium]|nr:hypothetical protein [Stellaceae bacterium]